MHEVQGCFLQICSLRKKIKNTAVGKKLYWAECEIWPRALGRSPWAWPIQENIEEAWRWASWAGWIETRRWKGRSQREAGLVAAPSSSRNVEAEDAASDWSLASDREQGR